jgi:signal transduction histidine kinase/HAMP domain-containing protein
MGVTRYVRFRGFSSLRGRVFWSVVPIVLSFLAFQGWMNVREYRQLVTEEFEKRGRALASNLGFASELGALSEDRQLLDGAMRGTLRNPDVAYVIIHGGDGRILATSGRPVVVEPQSDAIAVDRSLSRHVERAGERFIEFLSPILTEQAQTADELLIGARAEPAGAAPPRMKLIGGVRLGLSLAGVEEQVRGLAKLWGGITVAFLVVSAFVIYGFSRRITNPVKQLTEQAQKIAAGHLEEQIPVKSRDEIGQLATAFNSMTGALQVTTNDRERALAELQQLNGTLEDRIRQRTIELEDRGAALERSLAEVRAMGEASRAISSSLDLSEVLKTISTHAIRLSSADACGIFELDAVRQRLVVVASVAMDENVLKMLEQVPIAAGIGIGPISRALSHGLTVQVPDIAAAATLTNRDVYLRAGLRALVAMPMGSTSVSHVLVVYRRQPGGLDDQTVEVLAALANQSRSAIDSARLFKELADKSRQLEAASRHKSDFLANVSHELRTPMNAILGFNEMILDQVYGDIPDEMRRPLSDIQQSGRHLLRLINDVLDLSKIEAGRMDLAVSEYLVQDAVQTVWASLGSLAAEKDIEFLTVVPENIPPAYGDGRRITQCLMNLAGNALKFTRRGRVEIAVERLGDELRFRVSDTGIGIPRERIAGLFAEFQQADATIARDFGGTGLGLSITKRFVEMHGGRVWVESDLGKGSTFFFSIPLRLDTGGSV